MYPRLCRLSQAEREVEVCGLGMRSVSMCEYQGDICLDGHVCARQQSTDRALPINEVWKFQGANVRDLSRTWIPRELVRSWSAEQQPGLPPVRLLLRKRTSPPRRRQAGRPETGTSGCGVVPRFRPYAAPILKAACPE